MQTITLETDNKLCKNTLVICADKKLSSLNFRESPVCITVETDGAAYAEINTQAYYENNNVRTTNEVKIPIPKMTNHITVAIKCESIIGAALSDIKLKLMSRSISYTNLGLVS
ncbi:MAG: hypothetical protein V4649_13360 [Bacteroidota bacterium]